MKTYIKTIGIITGVVFVTLIQGCSTPPSNNNKKLFNNSVALLCATSTYRYGEQVLVSKNDISTSPDA